MSMLGALLSHTLKRPAGIVTTRARNPRDAERYGAYIPVAIGPRGIPAAAGLVFNISLDGAAIRIPGWEATAPGGWLTRLNQSEEMRLTGLLYTPMSCWVVVVDSDVLRVHFSLDDAQRQQLREVLRKLAKPGSPFITHGQKLRTPRQASTDPLDARQKTVRAPEVETT